MKLVFSKCRYKNLLSTGNAFTEIDFTAAPTTLIVGDNGSGKSTILDALCFGLFGKAFRKANKPTIVNSINQKDMVVEIEFSIGNRDFMIRRGMKPAIFEIYQDGIMINQSASVKDYQTYIEQNILKLNYRSFTQIVVLGSSLYIPFMALAAAQKREIIEDLLDISVFSFMNTILKDRMIENKENIALAQTRLMLAKERLNLKKAYLDSLEEDRQKFIAALDEKAANFATEIGDHTQKLESLAAQKSELLMTIPDVDFDAKIKNMHRLESSIKTKLKTANTNIEFFQTTDNCPTCERPLPEALKLKKIGTAQAEAAKLFAGLQTLRNEYAVIEDKIAQVSQIRHNLLQLEKVEAEAKTRLSLCKKALGDLQHEKEAQQKQNLGDLSKEKRELKELAQATKDCILYKRSLVNKRELFQVAHDLLKDGGIKTQIIRQYIPVINQLINKYLAAMDFFVAFELNENFEETIKSRYRDEFSYANFSEGEKLRIDLSLLLAWRSVARLKNSINTNIMILDEVLDASLDPDGSEAFIKLLQDLSGETNVFVISHKGDNLIDKFSRVLRFTKTKNFSQMVEG